MSVLFCKAQISDSFYNNLSLELRPVNKKALTDKEILTLLSSSNSDQIRMFNKDIMPFVLLSQQKILSNNKSDRVKFAKALGDFYVTNIHNNYDSIMYYYKKVIEYAGDDTVFNKEVSEACATLAPIYANNILFDSAINYLHRAQNKGNKNDSMFMYKLYNGYEVIYSNLALYEQSIEYSKKHNEMTPKRYVWGDNYTRTFFNIIGSYNKLYRDTKLKKYADSCRSIIYQIMERKKNETTWYAECYFYLAMLDYYDDNYKEVLRLSDSVLLPKYLNNMAGAPMTVPSCRLIRAISLIKLGNSEGIKILDTLQLLKRNFFAYREKNKALFEYAKAKGNWKKALEYYQNYIQYSDSLNLIANRGKVFEANQKYSVAEKEVEIKNLENKSLVQEKRESKMRSVAIIVSLALLLSIILGYAFYKRNQLKQTREKQKLAETLNKLEVDFNNERINLQEQQIKQIKEQRYRISADIHDGINSGLAALKFYVADLKQTSHDEKTENLLHSVESELESLYLQAREFLHKLSTEKVEADYSVANLLRGLKEKFDIISAIKINTSFIETELDKLSPNQQKELCMVIQESVTNILKYANADNVDIIIKVDNESCYFTIKDDGEGFDVTDTTKGLGLKSMENRVLSLNGKFSITSGKNGTVKQGSFPVG